VHCLESRCLSATGFRFLGILSRRGIPPLSRSAYRVATPGPRRGFHVPCVRDTTGVGAFLNPGASGVRATENTASAAACCLHQQPGPVTLVSVLPSRAWDHGASSEDSLVFARPAFP
jgi:hypothetical protein